MLPLRDGSSKSRWDSGWGIMKPGDVSLKCAEHKLGPALGLSTRESDPARFALKRRHYTRRVPILQGGFSRKTAAGLFRQPFFHGSQEGFVGFLKRLHAFFF
jgi:hypothetical protein